MVEDIQGADAAKIAAGLTKAQRDLLLALPTHAVATYSPRRILIELGLAIIVRPPDGQLHATRLGLAVRHHLQESGG